MGLFRTQTSTRSGFRRASLGTMLTTAGVVASVFVGLPKLHQSLSVSQSPAEMTCFELLQSGIPEQTSLVVLTDAAIHPPGEVELPSSAENVNPALAKMQALLASPRAKSLVDQMVRGEVLPRGVPKRGGHQPLKLSFSRETAKMAQEEVAQTGTLTVQVTKDPTAKLICQAARWGKLKLPEALAAQEDLPAYTLHPISQVGSTNHSLIWVVAGGLAVAIGLVLCGSARLGWWFILSPVGVILGLPGIPLRSGRGNRVTWLAGLAVGIAAVLGAYQLMIQMGGLGQPQGHWWLQAAGLLSASIGLAALVGTYFSIRTARVSRLSMDALDGFASSKSKSIRDANGNSGGIASESSEDAYALKSAKESSNYTRRYLDPKLSVSIETQTTGDLEQQNKSLEKLHFDSPLIIETCVADERMEATVQFGCRNLVLATIGSIDGEIQIRMTSVLEDGHVVLSSNGSDDRIATDLDCEFVSLRSFSGTIVAKLVTKHLEVAATIAEQRGSKLVTFDPSEWRDLIHYTERCLADGLHHAKIEKWDVANGHYGRFNFPPSEVATPALAGSF